MCVIACHIYIYILVRKKTLSLEKDREAYRERVWIRGEGRGAAALDLLKNSLYISSKLLINIVKGYLPFLIETTL